MQTRTHACHSVARAEEERGREEFIVGRSAGGQGKSECSSYAPLDINSCYTRSWPEVHRENEQRKRPFLTRAALDRIAKPGQLGNIQTR